ncbi:Cochaperone protein [Elasticomyces elasticus]|nr:Cochaperone protein [Elasticomyces elasticus]
MDYAAKGAAALSASNYAEAAKLYTEAIKASPTSPDYHIKRSMAYQRSSPPDYQSALNDAESAVVFAQKRAKRELIVQAQMRRAIALFGLERYGDAKFVLGIVKRLDPKEKMLAIWEGKTATRLKTIAEDDLRREVKAKETPAIDTEKANTVQDKQANENESIGGSMQKPAQAQQMPAAPAQTPGNKIRHDWYQNSDSVYFTLLAKGVPKDKAVVDIQSRSLGIAFPLITGSTFTFELDPLYATIDADNSSFSIMSTKIEVVLRKAQPGLKWHALEGTETDNTSHDDPEKEQRSKLAHAVLSADSAPKPAVAAVGAPSYPTSSRSGPKDWDKLAEDLTAKKPKAKASGDTASKGNADRDKDEDDDDDFNYDDEDGDPVNGFFKKLYAGADPNTRRAMMKSYTESGGTALSTNWDEVSKKPVEINPPDGMEAKKWGE